MIDATSSGIPGRPYVSENWMAAGSLGRSAYRAELLQPEASQVGAVTEASSRMATTTLPSILKASPKSA
jgi:hypothetical protein